MPISIASLTQVEDSAACSASIDGRRCEWIDGKGGDAGMREARVERLPTGAAVLALENAR